MAEKLTVSDIGEFELIARISALLRPTLGPGVMGAGDDCAVFPESSGRMCITTDTMIEGRHFALDYTSPFDLGWKALAVSLSDLAAMGVRPVGAVVSLSIPRTLSEQFVLDLYRGMAQLGSQFGVSIAGGNTTESEQISIGTTVWGEAVHAPILRSGAKSGDSVWVTGIVGEACAGLYMCRAGTAGGTAECLKRCLERYRKPLPRVALGSKLGASGKVNSMIDVSDGLLQDVGHLARLSGKHFRLLQEKIPVVHAAELPELGHLELFEEQMLCGGDDYELVFSAGRDFSPSELNAEGVLLTKIGEVLDSAEADAAGVSVQLRDGRLIAAGDFTAQLPGHAGGYEHFRSRS